MTVRMKRLRGFISRPSRLYAKVSETPTLLSQNSHPQLKVISIFLLIQTCRKVGKWAVLST